VGLLITVVLALLLLLSVDAVAAYSVVLGGLAFIIPNALFARYVFRHSAAESADLAVRWFYVGEVIKLIVTVLIFAACFNLIKPLNAIAMFATFVGIMVINLIGVSYMGTRQQPEAGIKRKL